MTKPVDRADAAANTNETPRSSCHNMPIIDGHCILCRQPIQPREAEVHAPQKLRRFQCSNCGDVVESPYDLSGSRHDVAQTAHCSGVTSLFEIPVTQPVSEQPAANNVHAYNPKCYYCRNGYCHDHAKGAGKAEFERVNGIEQPAVPSEQELPAHIWLSRHYPCLYRLERSSTEDVEYVPPLKPEPSEPVGQPEAPPPDKIYLGVWRTGTAADWIPSLRKCRDSDIEYVRALDAVDDAELGEIKRQVQCSGSQLCRRLLSLLTAARAELTTEKRLRRELKEIAQIGNALLVSCCSLAGLVL